MKRNHRPHSGRIAIPRKRVKKEIEQTIEIDGDGFNPEQARAIARSFYGHENLEETIFDDSPHRAVRDLREEDRYTERVPEQRIAPVYLPPPKVSATLFRPTQTNKHLPMVINSPQTDPKIKSALPTGNRERERVRNHSTTASAPPEVNGRNSSLSNGTISQQRHGHLNADRADMRAPARPDVGVPCTKNPLTMLADKAISGYNSTPGGLEFRAWISEQNPPLVDLHGLISYQQTVEIETGVDRALTLKESIGLVFAMQTNDIQNRRYAENKVKRDRITSEESKLLARFSFRNFDASEESRISITSFDSPSFREGIKYWDVLKNYMEYSTAKGNRQHEIHWIELFHIFVMAMLKDPEKIKFATVVLGRSSVHLLNIVADEDDKENIHHLLSFLLIAFKVSHNRQGHYRNLLFDALRSSMNEARRNMNNEYKKREGAREQDAKFNALLGVSENCTLGLSDGERDLNQNARIVRENSPDVCNNKVPKRIASPISSPERRSRSRSPLNTDVSMSSDNFD